MRTPAAGSLPANLTDEVRIALLDSAGHYKLRTFDSNLDIVEVFDARPARRFPAWPGKRNYDGWYWSRTTGKHIPCESLFEREAMIVSDYDQTVIDIAAQPFALLWPRSASHHFPDLALLRDDGAVLWGPPQRVCGVSYTIGRHDFTRTQMGFGDGPAGYALQVHVPPTGRLVEAESVESVQRGLAFFAEHCPDEPVSALVCRSWTLDPQLQEYLPDDSNLIRFQRRFQLLPHLPPADDSAGDRELMRLGLAAPATGALSDDDLERVPSGTTLQRAFHTHLRSGRHWHKRTGIQWVTR